MAVEIKEIVIRAIVSSTGQSELEEGSSKEKNDVLVQECVDQVLKVLNKKNRR